MSTFARPRAMIAVIAVTAAALLATSACSTSGRDLEPPTMAPNPPTTTLVAIEGDAGFTLSSTDFAAGAALPADIGAQTGNVSPALAWTSTPESAAELALVATNEAATTVYWLVTGLVTTDLIVERGRAPAGGTVRANTSGIAGWTGPVPSADGPTVVVFRLYALNEPLTVDPALTPDAVVEAISQRSFATATLTGTFSA
jgi:phosphatidylethanolamine-binding protein (PEBP) family uncharacterized protein